MSARGLEGIRVVELGEMVAAPYAAKILADLGADVVKVEPPAGDRARTRGPFPDDEPHPERSGLFLYLNTNKRSAVLDLDRADERADFERLVAGADALIHDVAPARSEALGLDDAALAAANPSLVTCAITPFGSTGPRRNYRAEEITVMHGGGWGWLSPGALELPDEPPLKPFGHQADFQAGLAGAMATLAGVYRARRSGVGEHIDLSGQAYIATILEQALPYYTYMGLVSHRAGQRALQPWAIFECKDGLIFLCTIEDDQWQRLVEFMGRPEWTELPLFADFPSRLENCDALRIFLGEWIAEWTVEELFHKGQQQRICFAPVLDMAQLAEQEHLQERGFFAEVDHPEAGRLVQLGPPYRLREPWWEVRRPAPRLGEHDAEVLRISEPPPRTPREIDATESDHHDHHDLPLSGVRVADFTWVWAGPFGAMQLAHLGAEVIKCESQDRPDLGRRLAVFPQDLEPGLNRSGYFNQWNQGKKSLRLNLGHPDAIGVARDLIAECDVVIENFATGVMDRLGLGYDAVSADHPDLIYASISGYGHAGPLRSYMAYGPAISPLSGLSSLTGYEGDGPRELGISLGDPTAGITAAGAICAALVARELHGGGQHIDVSLWESTAVLSGEGWMDHALNGRQPERRGNRDAQMAPHGCFPCAGKDAWVTIACSSEADWSSLCGVIPELASDPRFADEAGRKTHEDELDAILSAWTSNLDRWEVTGRLQAVGIAAFPSMTARDLAEDPHLESRGFLERLEHPEVGARVHAGIPWRLRGERNGVRAPAPQLGAHTNELLRDVLDYGPDTIDRLVRAGVLR